MHEMSVALEVCRMAEERLGENAPRLVTVAVEVGDDSGLEVANLEFCLSVLLAQPPFHHAQPLIERTGGSVLRLDFLEVDDERTDD
jgi:Zn finger protein HypA/HybF involved in hydrogenase expression